MMQNRLLVSRRGTPRERESAERGAVVAPGSTQDAAAGACALDPVLTGELCRRLDGFGAAAHEEERLSSVN